MRRVITIDDASHPSVPHSVELTGDGVGLLWQIYIDGAPFLGIPAVRDGSAVEPAREAHQLVMKALNTGRYEYVDLRLRPERRVDPDRPAVLTSATLAGFR